MAKKKAKPKSPPPVSFEESLQKLKEVVSELENGNLTLTDSLEKYEQGVSNLKQCYESLNSAQRRIEMLVDLDEEGNLVTRPFDNTSSVEMVKGGTRRGSSVESEDEEDSDEEEWDEESDDTGSLF